MCNHPYTNRDTFDFFTTCHVYIPISKFLYSLNVTLGFITFAYGIYEANRRKRKDIPLSAAMSALFLGSSYGIMLILDITFANRNLGLNIVHAMGRALNYLNLNLYTCRHIEIVTAVNSYVASLSSDLLNSIHRLTYWLFLVNFPVEILIFLIPSVMPSLPFVTFVGIGTLASMPVNVGLFIFFMFKLKNMLHTCEGDRAVYDPIETQLSRLTQSSLMTGIIAEILTLFWIVIPAIHQNLYILYTLQMLLSVWSQFISIFTTRHEDGTRPVRGTSKSTSNPQNRASRTKTSQKSSGVQATTTELENLNEPHKILANEYRLASSSIDSAVPQRLEASPSIESLGAEVGHPEETITLVVESDTLGSSQTTQETLFESKDSNDSVKGIFNPFVSATCTTTESRE